MNHLLSTLREQEEDIFSPAHFRQFICTAFDEDLGSGDHTSLAIISENAAGTAVLTAKEPGIAAGVALAREIVRFAHPPLEAEFFCADGEAIVSGQQLLSLSGSIRAILSTERLLLNCLQRMSGIATATRAMVTLIKGTKACLLDTRKTTPGFRRCEKWACRIGGAVNHRFGLYDMFLIKDNHIDFSGGIVPALRAVQAYKAQKGLSFKVIIEVRNRKELEEVLNFGGADRILLDNFSVQALSDAVNLVNGRFETEASGGITQENIRSVAETGVDYISVGALTHQIKSLDMSLNASLHPPTAY